MREDIKQKANQIWRISFGIFAIVWLIYLFLNQKRNPIKFPDIAPAIIFMLLAFPSKGKMAVIGRIISLICFIVSLCLEFL